MPVPAIPTIERHRASASGRPAPSSLVAPVGTLARARRRVVAPALLAMIVAGATPASATNDTEWGRQWGPQRIGVERAFGAGVTGAGVRIGIVDTGADLDHQDLAGRIVSNAACINTGGDQAKCSAGGGDDTDGHGTHVAGIAAATKDNGAGISGVAPDAGLVVARVFEGAASDGAYITDVTAGIKYVVDRGAKVVNLSLGDSVPLRGELFGNSSLDDGIAYAWDRGAVAVLAAGNANYFGLGAANYGNVNAVVVGAIGRNDQPAGYSSPTGDAKWAAVAPGGDRSSGGQSGQIYSTLPSNRYGYLEGTSMAAPHVSGALALLLSQGRTNVDAVSTLLATVDRSVPCGPNSPNCRGLVDVACAVAAQCGPVAAPTTPGAAGQPAASTSGDSGTQSGAGDVSAPAGGAGSPTSAPPGSAANAPGTGATAGDPGAPIGASGPAGSGTRQAGVGGAQPAPSRTSLKGRLVAGRPTDAAAVPPAGSTPAAPEAGALSSDGDSPAAISSGGGTHLAGPSHARHEGEAEGPSLALGAISAGLLVAVARSALAKRPWWPQNRRRRGLVES